MTDPAGLGRIVLRLVVASLLVAGAAACVALLKGDIGDVDWKIIATSTLLAIVSAAIGSGLAVRFRHPVLGYATAIASLLTFALVVIGMWPELDDDTFWRATGCCAIVALEGAHASFVLSRRRPDDPRSAVATTRIVVAAGAISGAMGIYALVGPVPDGAPAEVYAQIVGVVLVVQVVGTIVAPLLRRLGTGAARPAEPALTPAERLAEEIAAAADRIERIAAHPQVSDECERLRRLARAARAV
jgi:peptidoglycan/LPS O-acetylase OafA/YrhL